MDESGSDGGGKNSGGSDGRALENLGFEDAAAARAKVEDEGVRWTFRRQMPTHAAH